MATLRKPSLDCSTGFCENYVALRNRQVTATTKENLEALNQNIKVNTRLVQEQLSKSGATPDPAVVFSVAKYHATIEKLAKE
jgi:hypothetical protein